MKLGVLYSGGKDSNYALYKASQENEISCLITLFPDNEESYMFQTVGNDITKLQARALEIPQIIQKTKGEKELELKDLKTAIQRAKDEYQIEGIVTGAIKSAYQASRVQKICNELNLKCFNPLWQKDEIEFIQELIKSKFEILIVGVGAYPLNEKTLGRKLDHTMFYELKHMQEKFQLNPAGEGGEYETFVLNSPMFKEKIVLEEFETKMENHNAGILIPTKICLESEVVIEEKETYED